MGIRITQNSMAGAFTKNIQDIAAKMATSQQQIGDGRRITRPSDDPFGTGQVLGFDTQLKDVSRYQANARESISQLDAADSALDGVTSAMQRIHAKALQGASDTNNANDRLAIANEVRQLKEVVREAMNAQHGEVYIFGGTATATQPYPAPGNGYVGSANTMARRIGDNQSVQVNVAGDTVMGTSPGNALDIIDQLIADLTANNGAAVQGSIAGLQAATNRALDVRTQLGATSTRLELVATRLDLTEERLLAARSDVADVDAAEAYMRFTQQQTMYQAALASGTRILQTSILDFI